jgi:hypothetical protein
MSEADKKKARNKARKAELKAQKENKAPKKGTNLAEYPFLEIKPCTNCKCL